MEQFSLEKYLENPSRKVVTRSGHNVRILCTYQRGNMPIVALVEFETLDGVQIFYSDGKNESHREYDLFFADEEEKLTKFEEELINIVFKYKYWNNSKDEVIQYIKKDSKPLLDLARKEILKDLPKWKKIPHGISRKELLDMMHKHIVLAFNDCVDYYYLDESDLRKLPKEE